MHLPSGIGICHQKIKTTGIKCICHYLAFAICHLPSKIKTADIEQLQLTPKHLPSAHLQSVFGYLHVPWHQVNAKHLGCDRLIDMDQGAIGKAQWAGIKATTIWDDVSRCHPRVVEALTKGRCIGELVFVSKFLDTLLQDSLQLLQGLPWQVSVSCQVPNFQANGGQWQENNY